MDTRAPSFELKNTNTVGRITKVATANCKFNWQSRNFSYLPHRRRYTELGKLSLILGKVQLQEKRNGQLNLLPRISGAMSRMMNIKPFFLPKILSWEVQKQVLNSTSFVLQLFRSFQMNTTCLQSRLLTLTLALINSTSTKFALFSKCCIVAQLTVVFTYNILMCQGQLLSLSQNNYKNY